MKKPLKKVKKKGETGVVIKRLAKAEQRRVCI